MNGAAGEPIRLLIADDHPVVRDGLTGMFVADPDFSVVGEAADGSQALRLAEAVRPDVILMDLRMPGMDGVTAIAELARRGNPARVLVLTTYDTDSYVLPAIEAGATGYLLKDAPREELLRAVRAAAAGQSVLAPSVATRLMSRVREPAPEVLSQRELEVLALVASGSANRETAARLFISEATVKTHLLHIYAKLGVTDRAAAVAEAFNRGLLTPVKPERHLARRGLGSVRGRPPGPDAADAFDGVTHEIAGALGSRELGVRGHIDLGQAIEQVPGGLARLDRGSRLKHGVLVEEGAGHPRRVEGQDDARIPLDVPELHVSRHVTADEIIAVQSDPDNGHLRAAVGVDRAQVRHRAGLDQIPQFARQSAHSLSVPVIGTSGGNPRRGRMSRFHCSKQQHPAVGVVGADTGGALLRLATSARRQPRPRRNHRDPVTTSHRAGDDDGTE